MEKYKERGKTVLDRRKYVSHGSSADVDSNNHIITGDWRIVMKSCTVQLRTFA